MDYFPLLKKAGYCILEAENTIRKERTAIMRSYKKKKKEMQKLRLEQAICNQCGKEIKVEDGIIKEGCFSVDYPFDYFSDKDGFIYSLDLCEPCFDAWIKGFKKPVEIRESREFL